MLHETSRSLPSKRKNIQNLENLNLFLGGLELQLLKLGGVGMIGYV